MASIYAYYMCQAIETTTNTENDVVLEEDINNNNGNSNRIFNIHLHFNHSLEIYYPENIQIPLNTIETANPLNINHEFNQELERITTIMLSDTGVSSVFLRHVTSEVVGFASEIVNNPLNVRLNELNLVLFVFVVTPYNEIEEIDRGLNELMGLGDVPNSRFRPARASSITDLKKVKLDCCFLSESCVICLEDFLLGEEVSCLPCGHFFHGCCIVRWLEVSHLCPVCRFEMPS